MKLYMFLSLVLTFLAFGTVFGGEPFKVGDKVPEFKLPYATKDTVNFEGISSQELMGKRYLLAFYPADWSPGCTKEVCTFRDALSDLEKLNVTVLPVSVDNAFSHREWAKYHNLNFMLLSDHTGAFGNKFGIYDPTTGYLKRSVFLVGPDGEFKYMNYNYSVSDEKDFNALKDFLAKNP